MFPYRAENPTLRPPIVTMALIAANVLVWLLVQGAGADLAVQRTVCELGLIPGELTGAVTPGTTLPFGEGFQCVTTPGRHAAHLVTSMFLHGSWLHLLGNMWFLWLFGHNVEDAMSRPRFVAFYLSCGLVAAIAQVAAAPGSGVPIVGASGAISGVMGAYLILYPRVRVYALVPLGFFVTSIALPAWTMLLYWAGLQLLSGLASGGDSAGAGVAFWAHVGGFVAGVILVKPFARPEHPAALAEAERWRPKRVLWAWK
jgi:membrane associated rhomboid family serine protease